jgi:alkylation response protein AidB-like acyl-CoA dehydrogenase
MDLSFDADQQQFASELIEFLTDIADTPEMHNAQSIADEHSPTIYKQFGERGWLGLHLPVEYGGTGRGPIELAIFRDWTSYFRVPLGGFTSASRIGHALNLVGTEEQRQFFLPKLSRGDLILSIGYSEPEAGSDLASLRTRAVVTDDGFVVNGQKIFTTAGHLADYLFLACRTDPDQPRHRGITVLMVDLTSPGITIDPIWTLGGWRLNTIFLDDVEVPATAVVGEVNGGWSVVRTALDVERTGIQPLGMARRLLDDLYRVVDEDPDRLILPAAESRRLLNALSCRVTAGRVLAYQLAWRQAHGILSSHESATSKLIGSEAYQAVARQYTEILGGSVFSVAEDGRGSFEPEYRYAPQATIAAGTSEIMRNLIAREALGLPATS